MITGSTTAPPIKVVVPLLCPYFILGNSRLVFFFVKKSAPVSLSPVLSSDLEDTQITLTAAIAIFNLSEENRGLGSTSHLLKSQTSLATRETAKIQAN